MEPSRTGVKFESKRAGDLRNQSLFIWQGRMYAVVDDKQNDIGQIFVWAIAAGWTSNPDDRWILSLPIVNDGERIWCNLKNGEINVEPFMADCPVQTLMYERM